MMYRSSDSTWAQTSTGGGSIVPFRLGEMTTSDGARKTGVLFVLPKQLGHAAAIEAALLPSAQLARAIGLRLGGATILTPYGLLSPEEVRSLAVRAAPESSAARALLGAFPRPAATFLSDLPDW